MRYSTCSCGWESGDILLWKKKTVLAHPLRLIYNKPLITGVFSSDWKLALIVPLHKDGPKDLISNYRPISILAVFAKTFEQLLYPILAWHFKNLISPHQHGFTKSRSSSTNLTSLINEIAVEVDRRSAVDAVYTDFSKAFDRVNHRIILQKLFDNGAAEPLLSWRSSYLSARQPMVVASGFFSDPSSTPSSVPQGSHLGSLFFNIFINDIGDCFHHCRHYLFADDLKNFRIVNCASDVIFLQNDIDRLVSWCSRNNMDLRPNAIQFIFPEEKLELTTTTL